MAKTYIVTPNYTTRPPPTLQSVAKVPVSEGVNDISEAIAKPLTATDVGTLFLGDVLRFPLGSELSVLNRIDRIKVPNHLLALPPDVKQGFRATRQSLLKGRVGVWASLLAALGLPLGIELGVALERSSDDMISAESIETQEMEVDAEFIHKTMELGSCSGAPPALYIVTGLKIVYGASAQSETKSGMEASIGAQVLGQETAKVLEFMRSRLEGQEFASSTPFVLAFRARKILYRKGKWEHSLLQKGASMMDGGDATASHELEVIGIGEDVTPEPEAVEYEEVILQKDQEADTDWIVPEV